MTIKKIFIILLLTTILSSCWNLISQNNETIINKENKNNISNQNQDINKKQDIKVTTKQYDSEVDNKKGLKLSDLEEQLNKEAEEKQKQEKQKQEKIKSLMTNFFNDINKDKDIFIYIDKESIKVIKDNTEKVFSSFNNKEKKAFISELKEYWYPRNTFNVNNKDDLKSYINFIINWWFKRDRAIKEVKFNTFDNIDDKIVYVNITLIYQNSKIIKNKKYFINNETNKIIINN